MKFHGIWMFASRITSPSWHVRFAKHKVPYKLANQLVLFNLLVS